MKRSMRGQILAFSFLGLVAVTNQNCDQSRFAAENFSEDSSSQNLNSCDLPFGGSLPSGESIEMAAEASVPFGETCVFEMRTCSNGVLSGSFAFQNCDVEQAQSCTLPWGGVLLNGESERAYQSASVSYGQSCQSQLRICTNGNLSGSYTFAACTVQPPVTTTTTTTTTTSSTTSTTNTTLPGTPGTLTFQEGPLLQGAPDADYFSLQMADFSNDGNLNVLITSHNENGLTNRYWKGNGAGQFTELNRDQFGVGPSPAPNRGSLWSWLIDFNNDGRLDWFWDDVSPASLRINNGNGFTHYNPVPGVYGPRIMGLSDYNSDGIVDLVDDTGRVLDGRRVLDGTIGQNNLPAGTVLATVACTPVAFNRTPICASHLQGSPEGAVSNSLIRQAFPDGDLDGDGLKDLIVMHGESFSSTNEVRVYRNLGNGNYQYRAKLSSKMQPTYLNYSNAVIKDVNGDGRADIAIAGVTEGNAIFLNQGGFAFTRGAVFPVNTDSGKNFIAIGDYNRDGKMDAAVLRGTGAQLYRNTSP